MRARATSSYELPSETGLLVDACIARVREIARLDEEVVLPPLPRVAPRRDVVILLKEEITGRAAGTPASRTPDASAGDALGASLVLDIGRISPRSGTPKRRSRAALVLCALVACTFAVAAVLASPAGRPVADAARSLVR